ncbi:DUF2238 domain-containing protein [Alkalibacter rhizosphaerae]|uniref:DUF2238 domain-containing protein n=1 Tax=Alkalibacter rhizosphaerae TaxID=2815577 RepID=A0A974XFJ2_9FIRM|nr:DUF2238 domain-containing protein [Alkalibacter rhizosphaerae]QSX07685.1 DUF2238 domain-containing protein [Alkalibacter rhizosphaerae]
MKQKTSEQAVKTHLILLGIFFLVLIWSVIQPFDLLFWFMQALPAMLIVLGLVLTYRKFTFSTFVYVMVLIHTIILLIGAHHTYSRNPFFDFLMNEFQLERNYYDRVGHFAQGFVPAFMIKEFLFRRGHVKKGPVLNLIVIGLCLGISGFYELLELAASWVTGFPGEVIMGFQGDVWDTQWDMIMALTGAVLAILPLGPWHDKHMGKG